VLTRPPIFFHVWVDPLSPTAESVFFLPSFDAGFFSLLPFLLKRTRLPLLPSSSTQIRKAPQFASIRAVLGPRLGQSPLQKAPFPFYIFPSPFFLTVYNLIGFLPAWCSPQDLLRAWGNFDRFLVDSYFFPIKEHLLSADPQARVVLERRPLSVLFHTGKCFRPFPRP